MLIVDSLSYFFILHTSSSLFYSLSLSLSLSHTHTPSLTHHLSHTHSLSLTLSLSTVSAINDCDYADEFILLPLNGNHSETVFEDAIEGSYDYALKAPTINMCDFPPSNFIERGRVMQELFRHFVDSNRCVTLLGEKGKF